MKKANKGFTLVELIVVIGVLALLAIGAVIAFQGVQRNSRISAANSDAARLADALNTYNSAAAQAADRVTGANLATRAHPNGTGIALILVDPDQLLGNTDISVFFGTAARWQLIAGISPGASTHGAFIVFDDATGLWTVERGRITSHF